MYRIIWIRRYHTITDVYTTALLLTKPSSDDDSGFRHGFGAKASLPLTQSAPAVSYDTTRLCQIIVALWDCQIHASNFSQISWEREDHRHKSVTKKHEISISNILYKGETVWRKIICLKSQFQREFWLIKQKHILIASNIWIQQLARNLLYQFKKKKIK